MGHSNLVVQIRKDGTLLKSVKKMSGSGRKRCCKCGRVVSMDNAYMSYDGEGPMDHPLAKVVCVNCAPTKQAASDIMLKEILRSAMPAKKQVVSRKR